MRIGVVGINHKLADLKLREQLAKACQKHFGSSQSFHEDHHFVVLSTCNRTEVYFSSDDLPNTHSYLLSILRLDVTEEFDHKLYSYFGVDCFFHLSKVASGLDSAIIAETEIQGQVKVAYENAIEYRSLTKELHFLFQKSLGIAKKIRNDLQLGRGMPDLEHAILQTGRHFFPILEEVRILFVGASSINQKIITFLKNQKLASITLCNRSTKHAKEIAQKHNLELLQWNFLKNWHTYDWIIFGTKSPDFLITQHEIEQISIEEKLVMDLCVPRNVDPRLGLHGQITLLNIDQINRLLRIRHRGILQMISEAEKRIDAATQAHTDRYIQRENNKVSMLAFSA
jgi:glutamyl-tRNA reductase